MISIIFDDSISLPYKMLLVISIGAALIMALTLHEFAHAFAALKNGDKTAKINGRLSLNPARHLDPIGFVMLVVMGFGYARPVPVNPNNFRKKRLGVFTVSVAGVATNLMLAFLGLGIYAALWKFTSLSVSGSFIMLFLSYFIRFNLILCFFNLLPFFPLDGFNMLTAILKPNNRFLIFMRKYSYYMFIFLIGLSIVVSYVNLPHAVWQNLDILGLYLNTFSGWVENAFLWFWRLIFRI